MNNFITGLYLKAFEDQILKLPDTVPPTQQQNKTEPHIIILSYVVKFTAQPGRQICPYF